MAVSITFRPRDYNAVAGIKDFKKFIKTFADRWYIACERGKNGIEPNHLQCYVETSKRADKVREKIIEQYQLEDPMHAVRVRPLKADGRLYNLGYCQKESSGTFRTNIPETELKRGLEEWDEHHEEYERKKTKQKGKRMTFDVDSVYADILALHGDKGCREFDPQIYEQYMGDMLFNKHNYSLFARINDFKFHEAIDLALKTIRKNKK